MHDFFDTLFDTQIFHMHNFSFHPEGRGNLRIVPSEPTCCKRQWMHYERTRLGCYSLIFISQLMLRLVDWLGTTSLFYILSYVGDMYSFLSGWASDPNVKLTKSTFLRSQTDACKHMLQALLSWIEYWLKTIMLMMVMVMMSNSHTDMFCALNHYYF